MIYCYGVEHFIYYELLKTLPIGSVTRINNCDKLRKLIKSNDLILFWGWGKGDRKLQKELINCGVNIFPKGAQSLLIEDRITQLRILDTVTKYPLERIFIEGNGKLISLNTPKLSSNKIVTKIGNEHQGQGKYLKNQGDIVRTRENVVFEEFVDNARSVRICIITDSKEDIFIIDYIKDKNRFSYESIDNTWIGNVDCNDIAYTYENRYKLNIPNIDDIISDAINIKKYLNTDYLGIDYVINNVKTGFLEANDMIGLPDDENVHDRAKKFFTKLCLEYINNTDRFKKGN